MKTTQELFESGNYSKILDSRGNADISPRFWLGSLVFTGHEVEARHFFKSRAWANEDEKTECSFYLFLTSLRRSDHEDMLSDLKVLYTFYKKSGKSSSRFYLFQALGLMRFYRGEFGKALSWAKNAYEVSLDIKNDYFGLLANDLIGHSLCMMEEYSQGFLEFKKAKNYASIIENNTNAKVIDLSIMNYKIEAGIDLPQTSLQLDEWIATIKVDDNFSRTNALILKAKLLLLKGLFGDCEGLLNELAHSVYTLNKGRQVLNYNLTLVTLNCVIDGPRKTLGLIGTSLNLCRKGQDFYYLHRFKEVENFIRTLNGDGTDSLIHEYSKRTGRSVKEVYPLVAIPEKESIYLNKTQHSSARNYLKELKERELLGLSFLVGSLYREYLGRDFVDLSISGKDVFLCYQNNLSFIEGLSTNQFQLLSLLTEKEQWSRKELYQAFWGGEYDPFIHDNKIYVTLARLKNKIGDKNTFFQLEKGRILVNRLFTIKNKGGMARKIVTGHKFSQEMNPRQLSLMNEVKIGQILTPKDYSTLFNVSRNTVTNDLSELVSWGYLERSGKKRGSFYRVIDCKDP